MTDEDDGLGDDEPESGIFRWMSALVVLLAVAGFFGLAWYAYKNGGEAVDDKDVELIKADKTPIKEAPANPGGMQIPNQDKTVYNLISGKTEKPVVERILPAPEEPIERSGDTETWMSDSVKNKNGEPEEKPQENTEEKTANSESAPEPKTDSAELPKEQFNPSKIRASQASQAVQPKEIAVSPHVSIAEADPAVDIHSAPAKPATTAPVTPPVTPAPTKAAPAAGKGKKPVPADESGDSDNDNNAASKEKPAAKPPSGARVQLGSYRSQGEAERNWGKISRQFSDDLKSKRHYIVKASLGSKGTYYRLQVAPFDSSKDAEQFCLDFVSSGQGCILAKGK